MVPPPRPFTCADNAAKARVSFVRPSPRAPNISGVTASERAPAAREQADAVTKVAAPINVNSLFVTARSPKREVEEFIRFSETGASRLCRTATRASGRYNDRTGEKLRPSAASPRG